MLRSGVAYVGYVAIIIFCLQANKIHKW